MMMFGRIPRREEQAGKTQIHIPDDLLLKRRIDETAIRVAKHGSKFERVGGSHLDYSRE